MVLVTGGNGWLGRRLVRALLQQGRSVRIYGRLRVASRAGESVPGPLLEQVEFRAGEMTDGVAITEALNGVKTIFHLAAQKAVDLCERDPVQAVRTNVIGTSILLECAHNVGVSRLIAASTDKASEPAGVLGATKLLMERILTSAIGGPRSTAVRLGALPESGGSVLERWRRTARAGYIEVTDPEMTRFAMTSDEAIDLLIESAALDGGEIIAKALPAYRLGDLADVFAAERGTRIDVVGLRSGERTHEVLVSDAEAPYARRDGDLFVITPGQRQNGTGRYSSDRAPRVTTAQLADWVKD
jgi:UDP-N-acetylglucosamine 4,6-dehydratase